MNSAIQDLIDPPDQPSAAVQWIVRVVGARRLRRLAFFTLLLALWADIAREGWWPSYVLPGPIEVGAAVYDGLRDGVYLEAIRTSLMRLLIGYGIAALAGVVIGALLAAHDAVKDTLGALVAALQALPGVCWLPLAILWFGWHDPAVIVVVVMGSLFSIAGSVERAIRDTPPGLVAAARTQGAGGLRDYWQDVVPAALPGVLAGLTQGWALAWRSLMAAELLFYFLGRGQSLPSGSNLHDPAGVMAVMVLIIVAGVAFNHWLFAPLERELGERWGHRGHQP